MSPMQLIILYLSFGHYFHLQFSIQYPMLCMNRPTTPTFTSPNPQIRPLHFRPRSITSVNVISLKNLLQSLTYRSLTFLWSLSQAHTYSVPSRILVPDLHNLAFSPHSSPFRVGIANQFCTWYC